MTYAQEINPPYLYDKLTAGDIMDTFEGEPALSYNHDRIILIGGANLVLRNVIEHTPDIDLLAPSGLLKVVQDTESLGAEVLDAPLAARLGGATNKTLRFQAKGGAWVTMTDALGDGHFPMSYDVLDAAPQRTESVEGIRCLPLATLMLSKQTLGREKDYRHLQAIQRHLVGF